MDRKSPIERDVTREYVPSPGVPVNIVPIRRKSTSPQHVHLPVDVPVNHISNPSIDIPVNHARNLSIDVPVNRVASTDVRPRVQSTDVPIARPRVPSTDAPLSRPRIPSTEPPSRADPIIPPPPKMRGLSTQSSPKSPKQKGKAVVLVIPNLGVTADSR